MLNTNIVDKLQKENNEYLNKNKNLNKRIVNYYYCLLQ